MLRQPGRLSRYSSNNFLLMTDRITETNSCTPLSFVSDIWLWHQSNISAWFPWEENGQTYRQMNGSLLRLQLFLQWLSVDVSSSSVQLGKVYRLSCMWPTIVIFKRVNKIAKATISFVMSVHLSGGMGQLSSHLKEFHKIRNFKIFRKSGEKIQLPLKWNKNKGTLREDRYTFCIISRSVLALEWEMF